MLKILSVIERQTSFQIGSLRCVKYVKKKPNLTILIGLKSKKKFVNHGSQHSNPLP